MSNKIDFSGAMLNMKNMKNTSVGSSVSGKKKKKPKKREISNKVFLVHGHDEGLLDELVVFLNKINFDVIVSKELANKGDTLLEKIENSSDADFGVVLYTPCDIGAKNADPANMRARARQNVVFEHGYLLAKLGRNKVFTLTKGKLELPSDILGTLSISMDNSDWPTKLTAEFIAAKFTS
jgi:predicted nucleotide-binding protein